MSILLFEVREHKMRKRHQCDAKCQTQMAPAQLWSCAINIAMGAKKKLSPSSENACEVFCDR